MFGLFGGKKKQKTIGTNPNAYYNTEREAAGDKWNSLFDDAHVDPEAKPSMDALSEVRSHLFKMGLKYLKVRGLKIEST